MEKTSLLELGKIQRILLLTICCLLSLLLFFLRLNINTEKPLDLLARNSLDPQLALHNGHPTIIEFYADWCKVCQEMAPSIQSIKEKYVDIDIILLNVDNTKWLDLIEKYQVTGIPQLNLFDENGLIAGQFQGLKKIDQIDELANSLLKKKSLNTIPNIYNSNQIKSRINTKPNISNLKPRSHG